MDTEIEMELNRVLIQENSDQQLIFLKERFGERSFPIVIGTAEALAIDRRLKGIESPRPLTHDLIYNVIHGLEGELERIIVSDLREITVNGLPQFTYFALLIVRKGGELIEIDARPSDAIALGITQNTPIFVAEHVLNDASAG
jgi:hypothetical protein